MEGQLSFAFWLSEALANAKTVFSGTFDMLTDNALSLTFLGFALLGGGVRLFRKARRS